MDRASADSESQPEGKEAFVQNVFVMRHGVRQDDVDPSWAMNAERPWDPPLTEKGKENAWIVGKSLRNEGWNITRVLCSPFLRCVQTAAEVITALCLVDGNNDATNSREAVIDPSKVKISFEFGLSELMNARAIRNPPENAMFGGPDVPWHLDLVHLRSLWPAGTFDSSVQSIWHQLPPWRESSGHGHVRYKTTIVTAANMFSHENVLCITHGEGVGVAVTDVVGVKDFTYMVYGVTYCAYAHLQRTISSNSPGRLVTAGEWRLLTESSPTGVAYQTFPTDKDEFTQ